LNSVPRFFGVPPTLRPSSSVNGYFACWPKQTLPDGDGGCGDGKRRRPPQF
jgi:hypothetical protein